MTHDNTQSDVVEALPKAFRDQACAISKTGSTVTIECDDADYANDLLDWFAALSTKDSDAVLEEVERHLTNAVKRLTVHEDEIGDADQLKINCDKALAHVECAIAAIRKGDNA